jgi:hypothetical protein
MPFRLPLVSPTWQPETKQEKFGSISKDEWDIFGAIYLTDCNHLVRILNFEDILRSTVDPILQI